jgi:hypothetical protein
VLVKVAVFTKVPVTVDVNFEVGVGFEGVAGLLPQAIGMKHAIDIRRTAKEFKQNDRCIGTSRKNL